MQQFQHTLRKTLVIQYNLYTCETSEEKSPTYEQMTFDISNAQQSLNGNQLLSLYMLVSVCFSYIEALDALILRFREKKWTEFEHMFSLILRDLIEPFDSLLCEKGIPIYMYICI